MSFTETSFGRNRKALSRLEELLRIADLPQHCGLVIGAGLQIPLYGQQLKLNSKYSSFVTLQSWEYLELAAVFMRLRKELGKDWNITVLDSSDTVCEYLRKQKRVVIDDFVSFDEEDEAAELTAYAEHFLSTYGVSHEDGQNVMADFKDKTFGSLTLFALLEIPREVRSRVKVVSGTVSSLSTHGTDAYNVATMFNVWQYLPFVSLKEKKWAAHYLNDVISDDGIIATDEPVKGYRIIDTVKISSYDSGGNVLVKAVFCSNSPVLATIGQAAS